MLDCTPNISYTQYMLTLTKASEETKLVMRWGIISVIALIILFIIYGMLVSVKNTLFPLPPPKATVSYGPLPPIVFPQGITNAYTYTLNTVSGAFPVFDLNENVYPMVYNPPDLLALQNAGKKAQALGFTQGPYEINNQLYEWYANDAAQRHIIINIVNYGFTITANLTADPNIMSANKLPDEAGAVDFVKNYLQNINSYYPDIDESKTKTTLYSLRNNTFYPATSLSDAQIIRVDFFQKNVNNLPIYYEKPGSSIMNFLVSGGSYLPQLVGGSFVYQTPTSDFSTYPLKTAQEAFNELKVGKAYIASYYGASTNITINNIFLAYYIGSSTQKYLMPIIVFQGNNGFYAYVSAITDEWISK